MKALFFGALLVSLVGCGSNHQQSMGLSRSDEMVSESAVTVSFDRVRAGREYPTDSQMPSDLSSKKVLVISTPKVHDGSQRIIVDQSATLSDPRAGDDYPTDSPVPDSVKGKKVLVLGVHHRFIIDIQQAKARLDFPTDGPSDLDRDFLVWVFSDHKRFALSQIFSIEKAQAGVDYLTDDSGEINPNFYIAVTVGSEGFIRNPIP